MPTIKISLDPETCASLSAAAVRERRAIPGQAFVVLRGLLGLPFLWARREIRRSRSHTGGLGMIARVAYSLAEAAQTVGLSVGSLRYLIQTGRLRYGKVGRWVLDPARGAREVIAAGLNEGDGDPRRRRADSAQETATPRSTSDPWAFLQLFMDHRRH
jgi:hypothetical protein